MTNQQQGWGQPDPNQQYGQQSQPGQQAQQYGQQTQYGQPQQYGQAQYPQTQYPQTQYPQTQYPQAQYPQGQYANQPPQQSMAPTDQGFIEFTMQGNAFTSSMVVPTLTIDGHRVNARYGLNTIPVPSGPHHISVVGHWMRAYGQAELDLQVGPGEHVPVYYAAPFHQFTTGNIGHEPQKKKGLGLLLGLVIGIPVFILVVSIVAALAGS
ncbi:hypothetical protein ACSDQ9_03865 [Aestuariimicrobium soli]|uniref:hypothetical protein n=1 Tax=Aestuariimicrobium soli TaxID=2035834 RepID=UPI003EBDE9AD